MCYSVYPALVKTRPLLRVRGLPKDTQEPLLQQAFEKLVPVKRVEVLVGSGEAIVELVNLAVR